MSEHRPDRPRLRAVEGFPAEVRGQPVICLRDPLGLHHGIVYLPESAGTILAMLDGEHTILDIQAEVMRRHGELIYRERLEGFLQQLDHHYLLDTPRAAVRLAAVEGEFLRGRNRPAAFAGRSYEGDPELLGAQLDGYFTAPGGPGGPPAAAAEADIAAPSAARRPGRPDRCAGRPDPPLAEARQSRRHGVGHPAGTQRLAGGQGRWVPARGGQASGSRPLGAGAGVKGRGARPKPDGPAEAPRRAVAGAIVPHIDFARGGACYAWAYREIAQAPRPEVAVVLGTCHGRMEGFFALTRKAFETPLGPVAADLEFIERLAKAVPQDLFRDEAAHRTEHTIEFQAVFLRHLLGRDIGLVPILCGSLHRMVEARTSATADPPVAGCLAGLRRVLAEDGRRILVLASADLAHIGPRFGDPAPVTAARLRRVAEEDQAMLEPVAAGDAEAFYHAVARDGDRRRICGLAPIYGLLYVLEGRPGRLLKYDCWPDPQGAVSFASVVFDG